MPTLKIEKKIKISNFKLEDETFTNHTESTGDHHNMTFLNLNKIMLTFVFNTGFFLTYDFIDVINENP